MNGFTLKLIAMITMLIDHSTAILIPFNHPFYMIGRGIGRLSFPIFCFLIVEGLLHTRNVKKYLIRLLIFALLSEIPFDLAFYSPLLGNSYKYHQNIYFTLFIGLLVIYTLYQLDQKYSGDYFKRYVFGGIAVGIGCILAEFLKTDYSYIGVLLICSFYIFRNQPFFLTIAVFVINSMLGFPQILATLALLPIGWYNGKRGPQTNKYLFYAFYPVHLLCLYFLTT